MIGAVHVPDETTELLRLEDPQLVVGNPHLSRAWTSDLAGAFVPALMGKVVGSSSEDRRMGVSDDNRSVILPEQRTVIGDKEYFVSIKGCGARFDAFAHQYLNGEILKGICRDPNWSGLLSSCADGTTRFITGERWYGKSPYGAQAPDNALLALLASLRADGNQISGFHICPVIAAVRLPESIERLASSVYWYRRYEGGYWQEFRLMPSNVRLYFQSQVTFGMNTDAAFTLFHLDSMERCEAFLGNLARSSLAALTLYARTLRHDPSRERYLGLEFHDVWLDKDAVIAADGTLHFADLEGLEEEPCRGAPQVRDQITDQFYHHVYEVGFALEAMAAQTERMLAIGESRAERRRWLVQVIERACQADPYLRIERQGKRVVMVVEPAVDRSQTTVELELFSEVI